jgi:uncharacterized membrane protein
MRTLYLGVFSERDNAEKAIAALEHEGLDPKEMSVVVQDKHTAEHIEENTGAGVAEGAVSGATTGGVIGGIAGLLIGIGALTIPGIGAVLIGGPLAAALGLTGAAATTATGAMTGALAGGIVGALVGLGIPEETAKQYEEEIKAGGVLLAVPEFAGSRSREIMEEHGAGNVRSVNID